MTQVDFARKRKSRPEVAFLFVCGALDTAKSPVQNCVKHVRPHMALVFVTGFRADLDRCRER